MIRTPFSEIGADFHLVEVYRCRQTSTILFESRVTKRFRRYCVNLRTQYQTTRNLAMDKKVFPLRTSYFCCLFFRLFAMYAVKENRTSASLHFICRCNLVALAYLYLIITLHAERISLLLCYTGYTSGLYYGCSVSG